MIDVKLKQKKIVVTLKGALNANTEFPKLTKDNANEILIDMDGVSYINSGGIKSWFVWFQDINQSLTGYPITFVKMPALSVRQAASIRGFIPQGSKVNSFYVPYFCESCNNNSSVLYKNGENWDSNWSREDKIKKISESRCPKCNSVVEIDAIPEHYTDF
jgi:hypothetical protein